MATLEEFYKFLYNYDKIPVDGGVPIDDTTLPDYMYKDPEHYPEQVYDILTKISEGDYIGKNYYTLIKNIMDKKWGVDVRATLALSIYLNGMTLMHMAEELVKTENRQDASEMNYIQLRNEFQQVIANATVDSEVINARNSEKFGQFPVIDERFENIEKIIFSLVPKGTLIKIKRKVTANPIVSVREYQYGLGMVELGLEPEGLWGGSLPQIVNNNIKSWNEDTLIITVPEKFKEYRFIYRPEKNRYILTDGKIDGIIIEVTGGEPIGNDDDKSQVIIEGE